MKLFTLSVLYIILLLAFAPSSYAEEKPNFPSCVNPQGTVKASYNDGIHGIPGETNTYRGKDTVYALSDTTLMQCFCPSNGSGIQTNWWKVKDLSAEKIQVYKSQGWIYIADGSAWGLDKAPYLAENHKFSCSTPGTGGKDDSKSSSKTSSTSTGVGGGSIPSVLGLANTGNSFFISTIISIGLAFIASGLFVNRKRK